MASTSSWPRAALALCGARPSGASEAMRRHGLWEGAALLEDEALELEARAVLARRIRSGWEPLSVFDPCYPPRLRERLGSGAPPILWVKGKSDALGGRLCAIVGSRELTTEEQSFAVAAGRACAESGFGVVAGGARGSDLLGASGALDAGGFVAHILPGGAAKGQENACLLCWNPEEIAFLRMRALVRNRWVFAAADGAIVVASRLGIGGAWAGSIDAKRRRVTPIAVYMGRNPSPGNHCLARLGAAPLRNAEDVVNWLKRLPSAPAKLPI